METSTSTIRGQEGNSDAVEKSRREAADARPRASHGSPKARDALINKHLLRKNVAKTGEQYEETQSRKTTKIASIFDNSLS